ANIGKYDEALAAVDDALRLHSDDAQLHNERAWLLATCPDDEFRDGREALASATRACELTKWKAWGFLDTLAAAQAECGEFDSAVETQQKAIDLAPDHERADLKSRLDLYVAGKTYLDHPDSD
ncbi:MAG TPA: hypothetical protein VHV77_04985, partial [Pirellulales bacterium]|nr:hypothetical protein [Pirellulales bacterium]